MATLTVPKGDYGFNLAFTVKDASSAAYNLNGYTVKFNVWTEGVSGTLVVDGSCSVDSSAAGTCHYAVTSGDFSTAGNYIFEVELTKANTVESTRNYNLEVTDSA